MSRMVMCSSVFLIRCGLLILANFLLRAHRSKPLSSLRKKRGRHLVNTTRTMENLSLA